MERSTARRLFTRRPALPSRSLRSSARGVGGDAERNEDDGESPGEGAGAGNEGEEADEGTHRWCSSSGGERRAERHSGGGEVVLACEENEQLLKHCRE